MAQPRITKAFLEAKLAAAEAEIINLRLQLKHAQAVTAQAHADAREVSDKRRMMDRCRELTAQGVPCKIHRGVLVHSITLAPLN